MPTPLPRRHAATAAPPRRTARVLSRAVVVEAGMRVLDAEGLDAVTMRRVAADLSTGPASLYAHIRDKDDLVDALLDLVIGEMSMPGEPDAQRWQEQLKDYVRIGRAVFGRHRDIARAVLGRIPTSEKALEAAEWVMAVMRAGGVSDQAASWGLDVLSLYMNATAYEESVEDWSFDEATSDAHVHDQLHRLFAALPPDRFPTLVATAAALSSGSRDERFEFGLDMLVRGIASTVPTTQAR